MSVIPKPFAFVIMPFSPAFRDTYLLGIKPACEDAGYYCERLDEQIFEERMLDRIYNQIAKADLVVADLTERNPNVFYEAGYAHALGKRVILLTKNSDDIPFDLKHHFHIVYSSGISELKHQLRERAAYYAKNPSTATIDPFSQIDVLINGRKIKFPTNDLIIDCPLRIQSSNLGRRAYPVEASFHLRDDSTITEADIEIRLITPSLFNRSGWENGSGSSSVYSTILMTNGNVMHKPLSSPRLSPGDPDQVVFEIYPRIRAIVKEPQPMTLRLISSGIRRDIPFLANLLPTPGSIKFIPE